MKMKKIVAIIISIVIIMSLVACGSGNDPAKPTENPSTPSPTETADPGINNQGDTNTAARRSDITVENLKLGFILAADASDQGWNHNLEQARKRTAEEYGLREDQMFCKYWIPEDSACAAALDELITEGCDVIFGTAFGYGDYMLEAAKEHPEIEFCHFQGNYALTEGLPNLHNYNIDKTQAFYIMGVIAGMQTRNNTLGVISAFPFAEAISSGNGFLLGARSINPDAHVKVMYTNDWYNAIAVEQAANALLAQGCDVLGQNCPSSLAATAAETVDAFHVNFNADLKDAAPGSALCAVINNWTPYYNTVIDCMLTGKAIAQDGIGGFPDGALEVTDFNTAIIAEGMEEAVALAVQNLKDGQIIYTGPLNAKDGSEVLAAGETFVEPYSSPSWDVVLEGIEELG